MTGLRGEIHSRSYGDGTNGGDVYYFSSCASGRISRVLLADVTGHGEAVAGTGRALRDVMRGNVNVIRQSQLMNSVNEEFGQIANSGGFATAAVVTHFAPRSSLTISTAGHPPPLLFRETVGQWSLVYDRTTTTASQPLDLPLGITEDVDYTTVSFSVDPGDQLLMYTDAFSESRDRAGDMIGPGGLMTILNQASATDRTRIIPSLIERLKSMSAENLVSDDATVIVLQPTGRRIPMKDNLLAPWRMLRGVSEKHAAASYVGDCVR